MGPFLELARLHSSDRYQHKLPEGSDEAAPPVRSQAPRPKAGFCILQPALTSIHFLNISFSGVNFVKLGRELISQVVITLACLFRPCALIGGVPILDEAGAHHASMTLVLHRHTPEHGAADAAKVLLLGEPALDAFSNCVHPEVSVRIADGNAGSRKRGHLPNQFTVSSQKMMLGRGIQGSTNNLIHSAGIFLTVVTVTAQHLCRVAVQRERNGPAQA